MEQMTEKRLAEIEAYLLDPDRGLSYGASTDVEELIAFARQHLPKASAQAADDTKYAYPPPGYVVSKVFGVRVARPPSLTGTRTPSPPEA